MSQFTPKYFIKKFEAIPEEKWVCASRHEPGGKGCALGFTESEYFRGVWHETEETDAMRRIFAKDSIYNGGCAVASINNGALWIYDDVTEIPPGDTPKQRILNALYAKLRTAASLKD